MEVTSADGTIFKQRVTYGDSASGEAGVHLAGRIFRVGTKDREQDERCDGEFQPRGTFTEVFLTHEGFSNAEAREAHTKGWNGCFDMLAKALEA